MLILIKINMKYVKYKIFLTDLIFSVMKQT